MTPFIKMIELNFEACFNPIKAIVPSGGFIFYEKYKCGQ